MRTQLKINGEIKDVEIENGEITITENDVRFETRMDAMKYVISSDSLNGIHVHKIYEDVGFLPCFSSREKAEECIEAFKDDLTWLFTEFKWRMDGD